MDAMHVVLLVLALIGAGAAVWFGMRAARLGAEVVSAATRAERAEGEGVSLRGEVARLTGAVNAWENKAIALEKDVEAQAKAHGAEVRRVQDVARAQMEAVEDRERRMKEDFALFEAKMQQSFKALAGDALKSSTGEFLKLADQKFSGLQQASAGELDKKRQAFEQLVKPLSETLQRTDAKLAEIDKNRATTHAALVEQVRQMSDASLRLSEETRKLGDALRKPEVRGAYGEMQLRRVAEIAGMTAYCDFSEQESVEGVDGEKLRPDMVVKLPSGRRVVVDAKTNIQAYLDAVQATTPEDTHRHLDRFARHVSEQAIKLARKEYWKSVDGSPEFVVMFIPGDQFIDAALSRQPEILETAARQGVILASPATLIGLLRAVAVGYKEERLAQVAEELRALGREFHERMATALKPLSQLGGDLESAVRRYNEFVGSYESRLKPTLDKFEDAGVKGKKEVPAIVSVAAAPRQLEAPRALFTAPGS